MFTLNILNIINSLDIYQSLYIFFMIFLLSYLFIYDIKYLELPHKVTFPLIGLTILHNIVQEYSNISIQDIVIYIVLLIVSLSLIFSPDYEKSLFHKILIYIGYSIPLLGMYFIQSEILLSELIGVTLSLFFGLQYYFSRGKALGGGDIVFGIFMGLLLGWKLMLVGIFMSYILASFPALYLLLKYKRKHIQTPLGPFLIIGTLLTLFYGESILNWYMGLLV